MYRKTLSLVLAALICLGLGGNAFADPSACLNCHAASEFSEMDAKAVSDALAEVGIPPHRPFAELTEEEVKALLEALSE